MADDTRVERLVEDFARLRPDIDPQTKLVGARLLHLCDIVQRYYSSVAERFDVSLAGLSVLTALARSAPRALTLVEINRDVLVTSGGVTFLVARLENQGLVTKTPHPRDGRATLVRLTRRGNQLADEVIDAVALADAAVLADIDARDLDAANDLLTRLQAGVESALSPRTVSR